MVSQASRFRLDDRLVNTLRRASTVCAVRDNDGIEVLMVRRTLTAKFMPGVWVFPGGAVDDEDARAPASFGGNYDGSEWKVAALRELIEETGLWLTSAGTVSAPLTEDAFGAVEASDHMLDPDLLIYFANWVTPEVFPIRFDARFFLAVVDSDTNAVVDGKELIDLAWIPPLEALERDVDQDWVIPFPTMQTLNLLASESTTPALASRLRSLDGVLPVEPRLFVGDGEVKLLLPTDDGFDAAGQDQHDPTLLQRLAIVVQKGGRVPVEWRYRP
ncbi:MAG: NUDIX hydrolase [Acidimicrobiia bacterium]|nr:MAG: NUDIX hydrolase [Acidimicrobiia bacterium]